jgi:hypothetical protein
MARTTQSAKRSTGAPAPRMNLHPLRGIKNAAPNARKKAKLATAAKGKGGTRQNTKCLSITNSINIKTQPDVPTHVLEVESRGPINLNADMDKDHDEVCITFFALYNNMNLYPSGVLRAEMVVIASVATRAFGSSAAGA